MCTATLHRSEDSLLLTMNRDELHSRAPEIPPAIRAGDPAWMAPTDSQAGGTWIGVNDRGLAVCLLNAYWPEDAPVALSGRPEEMPRRPPRTEGVGVPSGRPDLFEPPVDPLRPSRGRIVPALLERGKFQDAMAWLFGEFDPKPYASFTLVVASLEGAERISRLPSGALERVPLEAEWSLVVSALFHRTEVAEWRRARFEQWREEGCAFLGETPAYHWLQAEDAKGLSPLMVRPDSSTRSITQVMIDAADGRAEMRYWPRPTPHIAGSRPEARLRLKWRAR
ncbi:MAG: NRDE family protein [Candidatus Sumerlaeota bacterium]|nr:NRDE family protein [Candidatus Sumerlaeota bacterium]